MEHRPGVSAPSRESVSVGRALHRGGRRAQYRLHAIDLYHLRLMLRPMGLALGVTLGALLAERMLRLFDLIVNQGAALMPVLTIAVSLTPHYLGLALPAAFCVGLMSTLIDMSRNNELDALESAGWSLRRIGASFVVAGVILALLSVLLFGFAQPYGRYAYRAAIHAIVTAGWSGHVEQGVFLEVDDDLVLSATEVDTSGRLLTGVFILQREADGETATTARRGVVVPNRLSGAIQLRLEDGVSLTPDGPLAFDTLLLARDLSARGEPFRPRGDSRELTLIELAQGTPDQLAPADRLELKAEFHARVVRSVSLIGIALAAIPLGVVGKRAPAWPRIVMALVLLTTYHHVLLFAQTLGANGTVDPALALWTACAAFMGFSLWLYAGTASQGGRSPARHLLRRIEALRAGTRAESR